MAALRWSRDWLRRRAALPVILSMDPSAATRDGVARSPKRFASRPFWSKKNGRSWGRIRSSGRPARSTIFAGRSWPRAQVTSAGRAPSMNSRSRVSGYTSRGLIRAPRAAIRVPSCARTSCSTVIEGSNSRVRRTRAGPMPSTRPGASMRSRPRSRASRRMRVRSPEDSSASSRASIRSSRSGSAMGHTAPRTPRSFAGTGRAASISTQAIAMSRRRDRRTRRVMAAPPRVWRAVP